MDAITTQEISTEQISQRFRGFLPVIVDVETGGFDPQVNPLLEVGVTTLYMCNQGLLHPKATYFYPVQPFAGAICETSALEFTGIDPYDSNRNAVAERQVITEMNAVIRKEVSLNQCNRAILVGHNAAFDLSFIKAANLRHDAKRSPFHPFSCFDTATLAGLALGHTVLAKSCSIAGIEFNNHQAHKADYDAMRTAELFCFIVNRWKALGGWPINIHSND